MNRRQKKKNEKIRRAKLHRILDQVLDINGLEARKREKTGFKPTAFYLVFGHTGDLSVSVHSTGWHTGSNPSYKADIYLDGSNSDRVIKDLDDLKERLHE